MKLPKLIRTSFRSAQRYLLNAIDTPAVVLVYHRVTHLDKDNRQLTVTPENFRDALQYLTRHYYMIDIEEFAYLKKSHKRFPPRSVLLTFDDGYADNYKEAVPLLESEGAAAIFFISTCRIDTGKEFWWDDIERIFLTGQTLPNRLEIEIGSRQVVCDTSSREKQREACETIRPLMRHSIADAQQKTIEALLQWSGLGPEGRASHQPLTRQEIKSMARSKSAVIGAHAHHHAQLSLHSPDRQHRGIKRSKEILEDIIESPVKFFSYPFGGREDYTSDTIRVCRKLAFDVCFSNFHFQVHRWTDRFQVPRMLVRNWDIETFKSRIDRFFKY
jgi:peptidoglycan/xylan/chitin deacetylase (PgdA/CDA1 family)